jgi:xanthine dehydrogenase accessory factor
MSHALLNEFLSGQNETFVVILGTNEIASAVAARLTCERFHVVLSHDPYPPVIRRGMAFHDALFDDRAEIDGIQGRRAETTMEIVQTLSQTGLVAVTSLQLTDIIALRMPDVLIDARMQKQRLTPNLRSMSRLSIGLGPNFTAGLNCDVAIETHPAHTGEVLKNGTTRPSDGVPRFLGGIGRERFIYSRRAGVWRTPLDIGARVFKDFVIGRLDGLPVPAPMDGFLRGVARDGVYVPQEVKLVEIDPRKRDSSWTGTDERGRAIAEAAMAALRQVLARRTAMPREALTHH